MGLAKAVPTGHLVLMNCGNNGQKCGLRQAFEPDGILDARVSRRVIGLSRRSSRSISTIASTVIADLHDERLANVRFFLLRIHLPTQSGFQLPTKLDGRFSSQADILICITKTRRCRLCCSDACLIFLCLVMLGAEMQ